MAAQNRTAFANNFGDNAQFIQGDANFYQPSSERPLQLDCVRNAGFNGDNKQHTPSCLPGTRETVLAQIREWAERDGERRIYWLKGMAGTGKSTIALTIAHEYHHKNRLGASFFFSRGGGDLASAGKLPETIAAQLAEFSPELYASISKAVDKNPRISGLDLPTKWDKLVLEPLSTLNKDGISGMLLFVLDALDECDHEDDVSLVIKCLARAAAVPNIDLRVFVTSRPEQPIKLGFMDHLSTGSHQDFVLHNIEKSVVDHDLTIYYQHELAKIARRNDVTYSHAELGPVIEVLVKRSHGLFIHAVTITRFIRSGRLLAAERLDAIAKSRVSPNHSIESELDSIYMTVLTLTLNPSLDQDETKCVKQVFHKVVGSIALLFDALSIDGISMLLEEPKPRIKSVVNQPHSVLDIPEQDNASIRLLHPSFREFLVNEKRYTHPMFLVDSKKAHEFLLNSCLNIMSRQLHQNMCDLETLGVSVNEIPKDVINGRIPLAVRYACLYWIDHLRESVIDPTHHLGVMDFFRTKYLFWYETLCLLGRQYEVGKMMSLLQEIIHRQSSALLNQETVKENESWDPTSPTLLEIAQDASEFVLIDRQRLGSFPLQIYSLLHFTPHSSTIRALYQHHIPKGIPGTNLAAKDWKALWSHSQVSEQLFAMELSSNGELVGLVFSDGHVTLWNIEKGIDYMIISRPQDKRCKVAFSSTSVIFATFLIPGSVSLWNTSTGRIMREIKHSSFLHGVMAFSPDDRFIALGCVASVGVWNLETGNMHWILEGHSQVITAICFSPNGRFIASASLDGSVRLWNIESGKERSILLHSRPVRSITISNDCKLVVSVSNRSTVRLWDVETGTERQTLNTDTDKRIRLVAISPNNELIALYTFSVLHSEIQVWNAADGSRMHRFRFGRLAVPTQMRFLGCNAHIWTNRGALRLPFSKSTCCSDVIYLSDDDWIIFREKKLVHLPFEVRRAVLFLWRKRAIFRGVVNGVLQVESAT